MQWTRSIAAQLALRVLVIILLIVALALLLTGRQYCSPHCGHLVTCDEHLPFTHWADYPTLAGQFYVCAVIVACVAFTGVMLVWLPLWRRNWHKLWPIVISSVLAVVTLCLCLAQIHYARCPWDNYWKDMLDPVKNVDAHDYEKRLANVMSAFHMTERDMYCIIYSPCYVMGWVYAAGALALAAVAHTADACVGATRPTGVLHALHARYDLRDGGGTVVLNNKRDKTAERRRAAAAAADAAGVAADNEGGHAAPPSYGEAFDGHGHPVDAVPMRFDRPVHLQLDKRIGRDGGDAHKHNNAYDVATEEINEMSEYPMNRNDDKNQTM